MIAGSLEGRAAVNVITVAVHAEYRTHSFALAAMTVAWNDEIDREGKMIGNGTEGDLEDKGRQDDGLGKLEERDILPNGRRKLWDF